MDKEERKRMRHAAPFLGEPGATELCRCLDYIDKLEAERDALLGNRRNRPVNEWGCKPDEDVCVEHDEPLVCPHGCSCAKQHECGDFSE